MRRSRRSATTARVDPDYEVVDVRERLAPYGHADLRPGWREQLIADDAKRRARRRKVDAWGFRG
jgi:hypothetical protein